ncbi:MAG: hypothetical protein AAGC49_09205 [Brevundimonas sp.]
MAIVVGPEHKAFPPSSWGRRVDDVVGTALADLQTPVLTLDRAALTHNLTAMFDWLATEGLAIAPHGKTTMAPQLWAELLDAGAWGLTLATGWQVQVAREAGVRRIMLANALVDPVGLRWLAAELDAHDEVEVVTWVDGPATVARMAEVLAPLRPRRRIPVVVELGGAGGRTGARGLDAALDVARAVAASPHLEVAGVGGYEGAVAHDRSADGLGRVDAYLDDVAALHRAVLAAGLYRDARPIVTAGGSAYPDRVAARLGSLRDEAVVLLRSGAFQVHDDGFYAGISPMGTLVGQVPFRAAMHGWTRVVSRPEPGLALLDAGKRDLPFDEGLPVPQRIVGATRALSEGVLTGSRITALNDQHAFLRLADDVASPDVLPVGTVVRLGLSHPCTALDKWRLVPVIDDADGAAPVLVDAIGTVF